MKILVTGANGFVGKNLVASLECIRDGKDRVHKINGLTEADGSYQPSELEIISYDISSTREELENACRDCDFVFNLAGVNRPKEQSEFMDGNFGFASTLLETLKKYNNTCPVMLSSSIQATLIGRYGESDYGKSKLAGEELFFNYSKETGARVLVYRFPNLFGKWCRPNYNSAVATFCNNIANDLPIQVNDRNTELELLYIDDLVEEMLLALNGAEHRCGYDGLQIIPVEVRWTAPVADDMYGNGVSEMAAGGKGANVIGMSGVNDRDGEVYATDSVNELANGILGKYCYVPVTYKVTLGEIVDLLESFREQPQTLVMPQIPEGSFAKKLYSMYLSYLPEEKISFPLKMNVDNRGSFTELFRTESCGQFSVNISKPGITKGQHWHHSKWEFFIVVSGHGLIQERRIGTDEDGNPYPVLEFEVSGDKIEAVHMLPGYTHNIINLSETENLVTVMWANEQFDAGRPDTFFEPVMIDKEKTNSWDCGNLWRCGRNV